MIKKILIVLSAILVLLFLLVNILMQLFSKLSEDLIIASLPKYESSDCYYSEGFQDFTNYCKYYFPNNDEILEALKVNRYLKPVTEDDVEEIKTKKEVSLKSGTSFLYFIVCSTLAQKSIAIVRSCTSTLVRRFSFSRKIGTATMRCILL